MKITFFVGNGFDINNGLNTRYSNFYPYFREHAAEDNMIKEWLQEDELLWADLEQQLGKELIRIEEKDKENLYRDKIELDKLLQEYLELEQKKFIIKERDNEIADELARSIATMYDGLHEVARDSLKSTRDNFLNESIHYSFISFNYTDTLDWVVDISKNLYPSIASHQGSARAINDYVDQVLHIHGTLNKEMILAVNDAEQIHNDFLKKDSEFLDTFIKKRINEGIGQRKTEHGQQLLDQSKIVCLYGLSIGDTDKMWWEKVVQWLYQSEWNKLIIFYYDGETDLTRNHPVRTIRMTNHIKRDFLEKGGASMEDPSLDDLMSRIFVSYNHNIFNFNNVDK